MDAVETFSFQHMNFDISPAGFMIFKGAILDAMEHDLQTDFSLDAKDGLSGLVNYVGAAMLFIRKGCALRAQLLSSSWQESHDRGNGKPRKTEQAQAEEEEGDGEFSPGGIRPERRSGDSDGSGSSGNKSSGSSGNRSPTNGGMKAMSMNLPTSFTEMFTISATVMGFGKGAATWMGDCLESFDAIVAHLGSAGRLQEECRTLVLRLSLYDKSIIVLPQFKACLLAALRSTLPKTWTTDHEEAWTWLWDNIVRILEATLDKIPIYEEALQTALSSFSPRQRYKVRSDMYTRFFALCPVGQNFFKQSNTRLHFIADRVLSMTAEWFKDPKGMVSELSALGLKHVGFGIPTELFTPFVTATVQVMRSYRADETIVEAFQWALILTANVLVRTILEGSTVVMKAVNMNSIKSLKTAVAAAPRGERATWLLHIQVGDQFISPLLWALENGSVHVAEAVLKDLLTIRADRARYYFGADTLFEKHPDIVKRLSDRAPQLLPVLLDGLVWRSHRTLENGQKRRVNYFVRHMLIASGGEFSPAIKWISSSGDPTIVSHPVVAFLVDTLWLGIVKTQFIYSRLWNVLSLVVFLFAQEIIPMLMDSYGRTTPLYWTLFVCRMFSYIVGMGRLGLIQLKRMWIWSRNTMKGILAEIDTDGNGEIDYEEALEALHRFKDTVSSEIKKAIAVLRGNNDIAAYEEEKKAMANKEKNMYNRISFAVMILLAAMLGQEPMIYCRNSPDWPTTQCPEASPELLYRYSIFAMAAMAVHWLMLIDMAVFSTEISAFLLVVREVMVEVRQFLTALSFLLLLFGSTIAISCRNCNQGGGTFDDMPNAVLSLLAITVGLYQGDYRDLGQDPLLLGCVFIYVTFAVVLLLNLLIAQLNRTYEYIYKDMLGFARLNRASLIVDAMASCPQAKWKKFHQSLAFDTRQEFDEGDLGLAGCIQVLEPAAVNRQAKEQVVRFGGSTSKEMPWPEDKARSAKGMDQMEMLEAIIQKTLKRMNTTHKTLSRHSSKDEVGVSFIGSTIQGNSHLNSSSHGLVSGSDTSSMTSDHS
ncbi:unnamed protein product [Polarella glacialis]|uniref:EF-hand domain-containing protein n=1 Tax=Polarella glacialis TaxID=89957 RepID=A0A813KQQ4_POLGL|nr:unnamed protein product [Polarella glacialis]CAE8709421.1 unnamed protein product [Polarella glacialis]